MLARTLQFSVEHRWLVVALAVLVAALGSSAFQRLPIDAVPDVTNVQVPINTVLPALTPHEMEKQVTQPIETALAGIPGLAETRSFSRSGFCQVTAVFADDVDIYFARNQVNERLAGVRDTLPTGATPVMGPISTGLGEVYMYIVEYAHPDGTGAAAADGAPGWQSDGSYVTPEGDRLASALELATYLRTVQDWVIRPQLRTVPDVAGVDSNGGYEKQYHVEPQPMRLLAYGLSFGDVIAALERNNVAAGAGVVERNGEAYLVRADARLANLDQIRAVPVGSRNGTPIYLRDVADVVPGRQLRTGSATERGREVVLGTALMLKGANSRTVAQAVDAKMAEIRRSLPPDVRVRTVLNRRKLVDATIHTVARNLVEGAALVVVVLLLVLGNVRAALICALSIPLSMLIAVTGMVQAGVSGNLMSLGAIDFGLIIDGAIITVEHCLRRLAARQVQLGRRLTLPERLGVVTTAAKEMVQPSVFGQAIIVTVYVPILALSGIEGKMFRPMALTVIMALAGALLLSLTLVPALVAIAFRGRVAERDNALVSSAAKLYAPVLRATQRWRLAVLALAVASFAGGAWLFGRLGSEFTPELDEQDIVVMATRPISTGIEQATRMQIELERALVDLPEVEHVFGRTGTPELATDPMTPNLTDTFLVLKPRAEWPDPALEKDALIARIEAIIAKVPGNTYEFTQPVQMRFNELIAGVRADIAVKVYGDDLARMQETAQEIAAVLAQIPGATDLKVEQTEGTPVINVVTDRDAVARAGLDMSAVLDVVAAAVGGRNAGVVFEGDRRVDLVVRLPERLRRDIDALAALPIPLHRDATPAATKPAADGGWHGTAGFALDPAIQAFLPLGALARFDLDEGPSQISRDNGKRMMTVQANVRGRDLGSFVAQAQRSVHSVALPPGGWLQWGGQFEHLVTARQRLAFVVPVCFFVIFVLLFTAFGSARHALVVFSGVPLGLTGGVVALWLRGMPFSISAAVGFIALSGVAVLNGLVMVSSINQLRRDGASAEDAVHRGSLSRLRPVLTTALVASLGFLPMALATGTGAEVQRPLATVVIGGLVSSTLLTLVVLPALYRVLGGGADARS